MATPFSSKKSGMPLLVLGALGVVFGDIGTSPLYALQTCFFGPHLLELSPRNILGVTSALIWSLILVVSVKYVAAVMRADNRGEGGILSLTTLTDRPDNPPRLRFIFVIIGVLGAALLYSDGVITPAISVLSAVEGLNAVTPRLAPYVVPAALAVLALLSLIQRRGTGSLSMFFGPIMVLWFIALGLFGLLAVVRFPAVLSAFNPLSALEFFVHHGYSGFFILGSIFLAVTGAEVLYADIGHFGKRPIRLAWLFAAFPCLALNYLGQSAVLLEGRQGEMTLFYALFPRPLLIPMIILATAATIIASQAVLSGMFSLARQANHLDYWPRLRQVHTSAAQAGQVYVPFVNIMLFLGTALLVLFFKESGKLAAAYGIAVSATMLLTTGLIISLSWTRWKRGRFLAVALALVFLPIDMGFFLANLAKAASGGWIVLAMSVGLFVIMFTWRKGRQILRERVASQSLDTDHFVRSLGKEGPIRVPGTAVFLTGNRVGTPRSLLHNFKHNRIVHERVIILSVVFEEVPYVEPGNRLVYSELGAGLHRADLHYGFFENPDVPEALKALPIPGFEFKPLQATYFVGRESLLVTPLPSMRRWRKRLFRFLSTNALDASEYFRLPSNRVVEIGLQVEI